MRILVVEDDPVTARIVFKLSSSWGYDPVIVRDGREAAKIFEGEVAPRIVLLNWILPDLDGPEVCKKIRATRRGRAAHIIMLTARAGDSDVIAAIEAGANGYLLKPVNAVELRGRLAEAVRRLELAPPAFDASRGAPTRLS
jgi:DNA-binding response OmpR family regulator